MVLAGRAPNRTAATHPISAATISFGIGNDVGASADNVWEMAVGDLHNDGDRDIVSGSGWPAEDTEVIVWEYNDAPFSGVWKEYEVGTTTADENSVVLADLDNDGDVDIVSGSTAPENYGIIAWENAMMCAHLPLVLKKCAQ